MKPKEKALFVAELAEQKLAEDIVILDMRKMSNVTDFFVILSASSTKRCQSIADNIEFGLSKEQECVSKIEGYREGVWVLVDSYDVVTHIFYGDTRKFYDLEGLWGDAPRIDFPASPAVLKTRAYSGGVSNQNLKTAIRRRRSIKLCQKKKKTRSKKTSIKK